MLQPVVGRVADVGLGIDDQPGFPLRSEDVVGMQIGAQQNRTIRGRRQGSKECEAGSDEAWVESAGGGRELRLALTRVEPDGALPRPHLQPLGLMLGLAVPPGDLEHHLDASAIARWRDPGRLPAGLKGGPTASDHTLASRPTVAGSVASQGCRPSRSAAWTRSPGSTSGASSRSIVTEHGAKQPQPARYPANRTGAPHPGSTARRAAAELLVPKAMSPRYEGKPKVSSDIGGGGMCEGVADP